MSNTITENEFFKANPPSLQESLRNSHVLIAGAGGLGSNLAMLLTRAGISRLTIIDFDRITPSNLNRQFFFRDQVGMYKVDALSVNLERINPELKLQTYKMRIDQSNSPGIIEKTAAGIHCECFDCAETKTIFARACLKTKPQTPLITVSGLAGISPIDELRISQPHPKLYIIGDGINEMNQINGTVSSRVMAAAAMQAHLTIRLICGIEPI